MVQTFKEKVAFQSMESEKKGWKLISHEIEKKSPFCGFFYLGTLLRDTGTSKGLMLELLIV